MLKLSIPQPCHEDWNNMLPAGQGRHCNACAKTVIDFTAMTDEEVQHFLLSSAGERICGRFNDAQLNRINITLPGNIFEYRLPWWKHFLAASLVAFSMLLFSCTTTVTGEPLMAKPTIDSVPKQHVPQHTMGIVAPRKPVNDSIPKKCTAVTGELKVSPTPVGQPMMGAVMVVDTPKNNHVIMGKIKPVKVNKKH